MASKVSKLSNKMQFPIKAAHSNTDSPTGPVYQDSSKTANKVSSSIATPSFKLIPAVVKDRNSVY